MPKDMRWRINKLMEDQRAEAGQPASFAMLKQDEFEQIAEAAPESSAAETDTEPEPETEDVVSEEITSPSDDSAADVGDEFAETPAEDIPTQDFEDPDQVDPPEDWTPPPAAAESEEQSSLETEDPTDREQLLQQQKEPDLESLTHFMGTQGNDQLFDGLAIQMAESMHRQLNRFQDRFDQRMAELDIGNSY